MGLLPAASSLLDPFLRSTLGVEAWPRSAVFTFAYGSFEHTLILACLAGAGPALLRGGRPGLETLFRSLRYFPQLMFYVFCPLLVCGVAGLILGVGVATGIPKTVLVIAGSVIVVFILLGLFRLVIVPYLVVDMGLNVQCAFERSWQLTRGRVRYIILIVSLLAVLGGLPIGFSLLSSSVATVLTAALTMVWWPVAGLMFASFYLSLSEETGNSAVSTEVDA